MASAEIGSFGLVVSKRPEGIDLVARLISIGIHEEVFYADWPWKAKLYFCIFSKRLTIYLDPKEKNRDFLLEVVEAFLETNIPWKNIKSFEETFSDKDFPHWHTKL